MLSSLNQCDGCCAGKPRKDGIHHMGSDLMVCTADRYLAEPVEELARQMGMDAATAYFETHGHEPCGQTVRVSEMDTDSVWIWVMLSGLDMGDSWTGLDESERVFADLDRDF